MATAVTLSADQFVDQLLATEDAEARRRLVEGANLSPVELHDAVLGIVARAQDLLGVDPRRAATACTDALALAERAGDPFLRAMVRMRYADAIALEGQNAKACVLYDEAAAVFTQLGRPVEAARTRIGWVEAATKLGRPGEALAAARKARRVLLEHGETYRVAVLDLQVGNVHLQHGRAFAALRCYTRSLTLSEAVGDAGRIHAAKSRMNRGIALVALGRHREALAELEHAQELNRSLGQAATCARVTRSIGLSRMQLGHYAAALGAFDEAHAAFRSLDLSTDAVWVAYHAADCYLALGRPADALAALDGAEEDLRRIDNAPEALATAARRVATHLMLGQGSDALAELDAAERRFPSGALRHRAWLATQRAALLARDAAPAETLAAVRRAQNLSRLAGVRHLVAEGCVVQASALLALGSTDDARRAALRARRLALSVDAAPLLHRAYELLARVAEAEGRPGLARRRYTRAIHEVEREQRGVIFEFRDSFAAGRMTSFERLSALQLGAGQPREALATAERAKSRALADAIVGKVELRPRGSAEARRLAQELARAREDYAVASASGNGEGQKEAVAPQAREGGGTRLAILEQRIASLLQRLQIAAGSEGFAELYGAQPELAPPPLDGDAALLEFFFSGDDILRFQVDALGVRGVALSGIVPEVERLLRAFRLNLDAMERAGGGRDAPLADQARAILSRLHQRLLGGLEDIGGRHLLVIVPHGMLHSLPFHALFDGDRYLVERYAICYSPSATLYGICRARRPRRGGRSLVLAHSAGGRLPGSLDEASAVGRVLGAPVHEEGCATRALLEAEGRRASLIHITAHARFRPDAPLFSCIELADGPLTTADVLNLDLRAGLVALSACETGRSVIGAADELAGLARAFLYAGAASLLVSQWRVGDSSTACLMERFYQELQRGAGRAEALRRAQLALISANVPQNPHEHPFYWAGFQIVGDDHGLRMRR